jgi:hypothetical protein
MDKEFKYFLPEQLLPSSLKILVGSGSRSKKEPNPGSGSATLLACFSRTYLVIFTYDLQQKKLKNVDHMNDGLR